MYELLTLGGISVSSFKNWTEKWTENNNSPPATRPAAVDVFERVSDDDVHLLVDFRAVSGDDALEGGVLFAAVVQDDGVATEGADFAIRVEDDVEATEIFAVAGSVQYEHPAPSPFSRGDFRH